MYKGTIEGIQVYYIRNSKNEVIAAVTRLEDAAAILKDSAIAGETYTAEKVPPHETQSK
jgi:hypothetical protein